MVIALNATNMQRALRQPGLYSKEKLETNIPAS